MSNSAEADMTREPLLPKSDSNFRPETGPGSGSGKFRFSSSFPSRGGSFRTFSAPGDNTAAKAVAAVDVEDEIKRRREQDKHIVLDSSYFAEEVGIQIRIAGPMVCVNLLQYSVLVISIIYAGHLGELELASASLGNSLASVLGFYIMLGMASSLETLCGQAYGAKQYYLLGLYLQKGLVVLYAACVPLTVLFFYIENILLLVGQDEEIAAKAGQYVIWLLPALYAYAALQALTKFLQTQSVVVPMVVCSAATLAIHAGLCWVITYKSGMGFRGAALATSISYWINVVLLALYLKTGVVRKEAWGDGLSKDALSDLRPFLKLAASSAVMICLEYWCFEVMVMVAGLLPDPQLELSALSICLSTVTINYMIPFGLSAAASTRVSNKLGSGEPNAARISVYIVMGLSFVQATVVCVALLLARNVWGWVFSNELEVVEYVASVVPIIACLALFDGIQGVLSGVARGAGWQDLGALVNLGTFYVVGVPVGLILAFKFNWAGQGLFTGLIVGLGLQMSTLALITFTTNWEKQAEKAVARNLLADEEYNKCGKVPNEDGNDQA